MLNLLLEQDAALHQCGKNCAWIFRIDPLATEHEDTLKSLLLIIAILRIKQNIL